MSMAPAAAFSHRSAPPSSAWDFRLPRVKSINASGHKFGLAPLGVGWVVWRESADLPEDLVFNVNYLGGDMPSFALNFSRPGGQIVCQYYNFLRLGTRRLPQDPDRLLRDRPVSGRGDRPRWGRSRSSTTARCQAGIPALCWKLKDGVDSQGYTLYDLADRLRARGWQVPAYSLPADVPGPGHPADPGAPRRQPGSGRAAARRHPPLPRLLRSAPDHQAPDRRRGVWLPPLRLARRPGPTPRSPGGLHERDGARGPAVAAAAGQLSMTEVGQHA